MKKPYLIYMNKTFNAWAMDAYKWMELNGKTKDDYEEVMSEVAFWSYLRNGYITGHDAVCFVHENLTGHY